MSHGRHLPFTDGLLPHCVTSIDKNAIANKCTAGCGKQMLGCAKSLSSYAINNHFIVPVCVGSTGRKCAIICFDGSRRYRRGGLISQPSTIHTLDRPIWRGGAPAWTAAVSSIPRLLRNVIYHTIHSTHGAWKAGWRNVVGLVGWTGEGLDIRSRGKEGED